MVMIKGMYNGPANSGNGGYVSGLVADEVLNAGFAGPGQVQLLQPPPLDAPLTFERDSDEVRLLTTGGAVIATGSTGSFRGDPPSFANAAEVEQGRATYKGYDIHPFGSCFSCGTEREDDSGLRIFPGPIAEDRVAAPWDAKEAFASDDGIIPNPIVWAAIDCVGGWAADQSVQAMLLGTMTAEVRRSPQSDQRYHVVGEVTERDGRKIYTSTALYTTEGELMARSEQVWIAINN